MAKAKRKEGGTATGADNKGVKKMAAVQQALDDLGYEAKPAAILDFVQSKFGVDMSSAMVSNYKSLLSRKAASRSMVARRAKAAPAVQERGAGITLNDVEAVKKLADRIGADNVRKLAEVLSS